jgi:hypothetical protein
MWKLLRSFAIFLRNPTVSYTFAPNIVGVTFRRLLLVRAVPYFVCFGALGATSDGERAKILPAKRWLRRAALTPRQIYLIRNKPQKSRSNLLTNHSFGEEQIFTKKGAISCRCRILSTAPVAIAALGIVAQAAVEGSSANVLPPRALILAKP